MAKHNPVTDSNLPIRTRLWVMTALALVVLPHVPRLPWWLSLFIIGMAALQVQRVRREQRNLPRYVILPLTILGTVGVWLHHGTLLGRDAGVALVSVMLVLKLLEMRSCRDAMVVVFMCYFVVITNFLFTQTPLIAAYMFAVTVIITTALAVTAHGVSSRGARSMLKQSGVLLLQGIPIMIVLFIFFPRIVGPLWGLPEDAHAGKTGLSETMSPGALSQLAKSEKEAFRVRFSGPVPEPSQRYWRGPVLWHSDGMTWTKGEVDTHGIPLGKKVSGEPVRYTVILEPHGKRWLFGLDLPVKFSVPAWTSMDYSWKRRKPVNERLSYEAVSHLDYNTGPLSVRLRDAALQLPGNITGRVRRLVDDLEDDSETPREVISRVLAHFNEQPFVYTLSPPRLEVNPVDQFLFETRRGFCEHYSAAFVTLLRVAGIPARVVTGYQGGEYNPVGDYWLVRQSDAHAWAEAWLEGEGWVRFDPTAAVAPERIEYGLDPSWLAEGEAAQFRLLDAGMFASGWRGLRYTLDALNNRWNEWVLAYGSERQRQFLQKLGFRSPDWKTMGLTLLVLVSSLLLLIAGWMFLRRPPASDPVVREWDRFCARLAKLGLARQPGEGPRDYARRVAGSRPELAAPVGDISALYMHLHYGRPSDYRTGVRLLKSQVRAFMRGAR